MIINEKDTLRKAFRLIRDTYSKDFISEISSAACKNIAELEEFKSASTVLLYFPINNELSPLPLLPLALKMGKSVAFPVCDHESGTLTFRELPAFQEKNDNTTENNPPLNKSLPCVSEGEEQPHERLATDHLSHDDKSLPCVKGGAEARGGGIVFDHLFPAKFGLFEPNNTCPILIPDEKTLCIVPAIAFDENGDRLGYGKGFYDRFLKDFKGTPVGLVHSELLVSYLPRDEHDTPICTVATEKEILRIQ